MAPTDPRRQKMVNGPPGWRVEPRPRTNEKYKGKIDWFYYEPGTRKQYRSHSKAWARYHETQQQILEVVAKEKSADGCSEKKKPRKPNMKKLARMKARTARSQLRNLKKLARMKARTASFHDGLVVEKNNADQAEKKDRTDQSDNA